MGLKHLRGCGCVVSCAYQFKFSHSPPSCNLYKVKNHAPRGGDLNVHVPMLYLQENLGHINFVKFHESVKCLVGKIISS